MNLTDSQYRAVVAHARRTAAAVARERYSDMNRRITDLQAQIELLQARPILYTGDKLPSLNAAPVKDGDRWLQGTEVFTYFRGQWRRKSELEAYASAAQYL